jgi:hypothetical protein
MFDFYYVPHAIEDLTFIQQAAIHTVSGCYGVGKTHFLNEYLKCHFASDIVVSHDMDFGRDLDQKARIEKCLLTIWDELDKEASEQDFEMIWEEARPKNKTPLDDLKSKALALARFMENKSENTEKRKRFKTVISKGIATDIAKFLSSRLRERNVQKKIIWCIIGVDNKSSEMEIRKITNTLVFPKWGQIKA